MLYMYLVVHIEDGPVTEMIHRESLTIPVVGRESLNVAACNCLVPATLSL